MLQMEEELVCIDDALLAETQARINRVFTNDLLFPVYVIQEPSERKESIMAVCGGASSHFYRDKISDWQGPGYVIMVYRDEMSRPDFYGSILHEIAHCCQATMPPPWACLPEEIGLFPVPKENLRPVSGTPYDNYKVHQPDFWRLALHAWARGVDAGFPCDVHHLGQTLVDSDLMFETIKPEIEQLAEYPLWKIGKRPVPRTFAKVFDIDLDILIANSKSQP